MCVACLNGGFHQSTETDTNPLNLGTLTEQVAGPELEVVDIEPTRPWHKECNTTVTDPLVNGLISETWGPWMKESWGFLDDNKVDFYVDPSIPQPQRKYAKKVIRKIDRLTATKMEIQHHPSLADVIVDDVESYGPEFSHANGLAFIDEESQKIYASWLTDWNHTWTNRRGKERLTNYNKRLITHEILHTIGISHPFDDGNYEGYTNEDTAMSYNYVTDDVKKPMRDADILAVQEIWGGVC